MGLAMIMIMIFHTSIEYPGALDLVKNFGDFGVNIFFMISGYSMYYAWKKNDSVSYFYKKRFARIAYTFYPIALIWIVLSVALHECGITEAICKLLTIQFWIDGNLLHWFVSGIIVCYFVTPFWNILNDRSEKMCLFVSIIISLACIILPYYHFGNHITCFLQRFPTYVIGLYIGKESFEKKEMTKIDKIAIWGLGIIGIAVFALIRFDTMNYKWKYVIYLLLTIPIVFLLSNILLKSGKTGKILSFLGTVTLEYYLLQEKILKISTMLLNKLKMHIDERRVVLNLVVIVVTFVIAVIYQKAIIKAQKIRQK